MQGKIRGRMYWKMQTKRARIAISTLIKLIVVLAFAATLFYIFFSLRKKIFP